MEIASKILEAVWNYVVANPGVVFSAAAIFIGLAAACIRFGTAYEERIESRSKALKVSIAAFADTLGTVQINVVSSSDSALQMKADVVEDQSRWKWFLRRSIGKETFVIVTMDREFDPLTEIPAGGTTTLFGSMNKESAQKYKRRWLLPLLVRVVASGPPMIVPVKWMKALARA